MDSRESDGLVRFMMADSSRQHDKEFEAVYFITMKKTDIAEAVQHMNDLIELGELGTGFCFP